MRADAEAAGVLENAAARLDEDCKGTVRRQHVDDLPGAAGDADFDILGDVFPLQDLRHGADITVGRVRA